MKKSDIKIGAKYAVRFKTDEIPGIVVRPGEGHEWIVVLDPQPGFPIDPASGRTYSIPSRRIIAPWTDYCIDSAHALALKEDQVRTWDAKYEAEREAEAKRKAPFIEALQGITVPGATFTSSNVALPDVDLAEKLNEIFVEQTVVGTSVTFDVFEALAREILDLRTALLDSGGVWVGDATDTGVPEVDATVAAAAGAAQAVAALEAKVDA